MTRSRGAALLAAVLAVVVVVLAVAAALRGPTSLPVVAHLGGTPVHLALVQPAIAVLVPPALVAVVAALRARGRLERPAVVWASGAAAPIVLFLVARLNGIAEATALVLVYAASGGGVLLRSLHRVGGDPAALRWWSVLGIVPWGVVAFAQVVALLVSDPPSAAVRVLTPVVLAASVLEFVVVYRRRDDPPPETVGLVLAALPGVLLAVLTVATVG